MLTIESNEAISLASELAGLTGKSLGDVVLVSLRKEAGDCFAYALAKSFSQPLLFKGDDFSQTDIRAAPY